MKKIFIGCDHGALELKNELYNYLKENYDILDMGVYEEKSVDYPDIALLVCSQVKDVENSCGILLCGTGIGISIAANKIKGIRAALCHESYSARMSRAHNNANVCVLGGRVTGPELAKDIVDTFLTTDFDGGRHAVRVEKIHALEK